MLAIRDKAQRHKAHNDSSKISKNNNTDTHSQLPLAYLESIPNSTLSKPNILLPSPPPALASLLEFSISEQSTISSHSLGQNHDRLLTPLSSPLPPVLVNLPVYILPHASCSHCLISISHLLLHELCWQSNNWSPYLQDWPTFNSFSIYLPLELF